MNVETNCNNIYKTERSCIIDRHVSCAVHIIFISDIIIISPVNIIVNRNNIFIYIYVSIYKPCIKEPIYCNIMHADM